MLILRVGNNQASVLAAALLCTLSVTRLCAQEPILSSLTKMDRRTQISRADLDYDIPATRSEEGMPIGNGRMGSLIWTTPDTVRMQINRVDVHSIDGRSFSFPDVSSDYSNGCAYVDIHLSHLSEVLSGNSFHQHLSLYNGQMSLVGRGVSVRAIAWPTADVMALEITDNRSHPEAIDIDLRMLRFIMQRTAHQMYSLRQQHSVIVHTGAHTATSVLSVDMPAQLAALKQQFQEDDFYDSSAVAIQVIGRSARAHYRDESAAELSVQAGRGTFVVLIASAEKSSKVDDPVQQARNELARAAAFSFSQLTQSTAKWWHDFWGKGLIYLHSASGQADYVEQNYDMFLYLMASSSRGRYPARYAASLWGTDGDMGMWGSQYWWANQMAYVSNLMPSNHVDLLDPFFNMYFGMYDNAALAARQQWGTVGIWIPETTFFNGPEPLPADIANELQDLMLLRKPFEQRSTSFDAYAQKKNHYNARWNFQADGKWIRGEYTSTSKGNGIFGHTTHILGNASRLGALAWQNYQLTGDEVFLRLAAYPIIKGAAEFYRNFPNLFRDRDGIYHLHHTNSAEHDWDSLDAPYEIAAMHLILPIAAQAARILGVDADLAPKWLDLDRHIEPTPIAFKGFLGDVGSGNFTTFTSSAGGAPIAPLGPEAELKKRFLAFTGTGNFIDEPSIGGAAILRNRMRLREGPGAIDYEHIAGLAGGLHLALLDSHPEAVGEDEPIQIFSAWPKDWDCAFTLLARGAFLVTASQQTGRIGPVAVTAQREGIFSMRNPWPGADVTLFRNGMRSETLSTDVLSFSATAGEQFLLLREDDAERQVEHGRL